MKIKASLFREYLLQVRGPKTAPLEDIVIAMTKDGLNSVVQESGGLRRVKVFMPWPTPQDEIDTKPICLAKLQQIIAGLERFEDEEITAEREDGKFVMRGGRKRFAVPELSDQFINPGREFSEEGMAIVAIKEEMLEELLDDMRLIGDNSVVTLTQSGGKLATHVASGECMSVFDTTFEIPAETPDFSIAFRLSNFCVFNMVEGDAEITVKSNYPMKIKYKTEDNIEVEYWLAPHIDKKD